VESVTAKVILQEYDMANALATMDTKPSTGASDYNHRAAAGKNVPKDSPGHVGFLKTETEEGLQEGYEANLENAEIIRSRCRAKDAKEGIPFYVCPMCKAGKGRKQYDTKPECAKHIKAEHGNEVVVMKHDKAPKFKYMPTKFIRSPKRTLEDLTTSKQAAMQRQAVETQSKFRPILNQAQAGGTAKLTAQMVMSQPESVGMNRARKLNDVELHKLAMMAITRGKRTLARACRRLCAERNIKLML
jgi:hypothetical protein